MRDLDAEQDLNNCNIIKKKLTFKTMFGETTSTEVKKTPLDYEYISNDPAENADNFDPKWASFRELNTNEERYQAIRKRWGNENIPDPRINLTFRKIKSQSASNTKENCTSPAQSSVSNTQQNPLDRSRQKKRQVSRRRSRSCTRPYEQLISNIRKNYMMGYSQLKYRHEVELQEMLQVQDWQMNACSLFYDSMTQQNLQIQQEQEVLHLLSNQFKEVQCFLGKKNENIDVCLSYMEEVKAFFSFYQKINDDEITLQMSDEQYEHTVETEKMYSLYHLYYC